MSLKYRTMCAALVGCGLNVSASQGAMIARWQFEEPAGSTTVGGGSYQGTPVIGTLLGSPTIVVGTGVLGNCLRFDGPDDLVDVGTVLNGLGNRCFTITAWVKTTMTGTGIVLGSHDSGIQAGYFMGLNTSGGCYGAQDKAYMYVSAACPVPTSTISVNNNIWHLIAMVYAPGLTAKLYVDGVLQSSTPAPLFASATAPLLFGGMVVGGVKTNFFTGDIDEVRIYDRALSPAALGIMAIQRSHLPSDCVSDLNCTATTDGLDLAMLLSKWTGAAMYSGCPGTTIPEDLSQDCRVNGIDLAMMLSAWGLCSGG